MDLSTAAGRWGQAVERPQALEAGEATQAPGRLLKGSELLVVDGIDFGAFADDYDRQAMVLSAPVPTWVPARQLRSP